MSLDLEATTGGAGIWFISVYAGNGTLVQTFTMDSPGLSAHLTANRHLYDSVTYLSR